MNLLDLVLKELWHRKSQLISGLLAITLGIAVIVGIRTISIFSEKAVAINLDNLGANILVLPLGATTDNYYSADIDAPTFPEDYVERLVTSTLPGVDNLSPKLSQKIKIQNTSLILTGILPANELKSKPLWQQSGLVGDELKLSCDPSSMVNQSSGYEDPKLQRKAVDTLEASDCLVGFSVAGFLKIQEGSELSILNKPFKVAKILPETGTVDDDRIFAHLHSVQSLLGLGNQVNAIEIMGCCNAITDGLLGKIRNILPDTKISTITQIVSTQVETNRLMRKISLTFLILIILVGGISIGNFIWANVNERRREIGMFRMIGYPRVAIYYILIFKAILLGFFGGVIGYLLGTSIAMILGSDLARLTINPVPSLLIWALLISIFTSIVGSLIPVYLASKIDPFVNIQEF